MKILLLYTEKISHKFKAIKLLLSLCRTRRPYVRHTLRPVPKDRATGNGARNGRDNVGTAIGNNNGNGELF